KVWSKPVVDERSTLKLFFGADAETVYVTTAGTTPKFVVFDTKTGAARGELRGAGLPTSPMHIWPLGRERLAVFGFPQRVPGLWDAKTGDPLPALVDQDAVLLPPIGIQSSAIECQMSPDGRFVFAGYQGPFRDLRLGPAPYRVTEVATGKIVSQGDWT